jgi:hypothetical protein
LGFLCADSRGLILKITENGVEGRWRQEPLEICAEDALMPHDRSYFTHFLDVARGEKALIAVDKW